MTAAFGKLQGQTLDLKEGLNIIQAPNETGKSTWCAFLLSMFYGINSRERERASFIPDKIRYAPWSGAPMSGRLECTVAGEDLTLTRATRRQTAPMGDFKAVYSGTGTPVPDLTGPTCGEILLGVNREIFERSAFIRQSGLAISQDASLERRIASLITAGEEEVSFSEAYDLLKKQLNHRRHNRTGQIPALEAELQDTLRQIARSAELEQQLKDAASRIETHSACEAILTEELRRHAHWELLQKRQALERSAENLRQADSRAAAMRQQLEDDRIPESEAILRLQSNIANLDVTRKQAEAARAAQSDAHNARLQAEASLNESPFAGQTPEEVRKEVADPPKGTVNAIPAILAVYGAAAILTIALYFLLPDLSPAAGLGFIGFPLICISAAVSALLVRRLRRKAQTAALTKRYGTSDTAEIQALADTYYKLYQAHKAAQAELNTKTATTEALRSTLISNEQAILLEIRRFAPTALDIPTAETLLRECAAHRRQLTDAEAAAEKARMYHNLLQQEPLPAEAAALDPQMSPPEREKRTVSDELAQVRSELARLHSTADHLSGQLHTAGDPVILKSEADRLQEQIAALEREYAALQLSMDALDRANISIQNRFSPELGHRTAEIFSALTDGQYGGVVLDRNFHLSAEPQGDAVYRDAGLLSAGTADQLYLAARLAICDLALPRDRAVPIILDDALANFDDHRCAAALRWLKQEAQHRQILLFTCHSREADFFANDSKVFIQRLTEPA